MDKEQVIQMARDAGLASFGGWTEQNIENFAYAVRAATKEEDAKICDELALERDSIGIVSVQMVSDIIRSSK